MRKDLGQNRRFLAAHGKTSTNKYVSNVGRRVKSAFQTTITLRVPSNLVNSKIDWTSFRRFEFTYPNLALKICSLSLRLFFAHDSIRKITLIRSRQCTCGIFISTTQQPFRKQNWDERIEYTKTINLTPIQIFFFSANLESPRVDRILNRKLCTPNFWRYFVLLSCA